MAELPDGNIVQLPAPGSRRPVSTIDTGAVSRAGAAFASGAETLGKGIASAAHDAAVVFKQEQEAALKFGHASANAVMQSGLLEDATAIDAEKDPTDLGEKYKTKVNERLNAARQLIKDERQQQLFHLSQQDNIARVIQAAKRKEFSLLSEAEMAADYASMKQAGEHAIRQSAGDSKAMDLAIGTVHGYVDKWVAKGYMTPAKAGEYKQKAALDLAERKLLALPTIEKYEALSGGPAHRMDRTPHAALLDRIAQEEGVPAHFLKGVAFVESGGRAHAQKNKGLFQLSDEKFKTFGGTGDIFDVEQNTRAGARSLKAEIAQLRTKLGQEPTLTQIYLAHQQGQGGLTAHMANPDKPAWENMLSTGEGKQKGADWAKQAVWGNVPDDIKRRFPNSVESVTSRQFMDLWAEKIDGGPAARYADLVSMLPADKLERMRLDAERDYLQVTTKASYEAFNGYQRAFVDAAAGLGPVPDRKKIETDPNLLEPDRNKLLASHGPAVNDAAGLQAYVARYQDRSASFNPLDEATVGLTNRYYGLLGRTPAALRDITDRTGILPKDAAVELRGALESKNRNEVHAALKMLSDMDDRVFVNGQYSWELAEARETYRAKYLINGAADKAVAQFMDERDEEISSKGENAEAKLRRKQRLETLIGDNVTHDQMRRKLDQTGWGKTLGLTWLTNRVGSTNAEAEANLAAFQDLTRRVFRSQRSENLDEAMVKAASLFGKTFGPTTMYGPDQTAPEKEWGKEVRTVRFAPSAYPEYIKPVEGKSQIEKDEIDRLIKRVAAKHVDKWAGERVDENRVWLRPLGFQKTEERFFAGNPKEPPIYALWFQDGKNFIHVIGEFYATPDELREAKSELHREDAALRKIVEQQRQRQEQERALRL
jgi:hypothetical protein